MEREEKEGDEDKAQELEPEKEEEDREPRWAKLTRAAPALFCSPACAGGSSATARGGLP